MEPGRTAPTCPSIYWCACVFVWKGKQRCIQSKNERERDEMCTILHVRVYTHSVLNRRELHENVPPFSFNRPLETVQRTFCWLIGEIRSKGGGWLQRLAEPAFFFFFHTMEAPLSIGTHLPCCVIVAHNGAHLIQAAQGFFLKPFSSIHTNKSCFREILRSLLSSGPPHICLWMKCCV